MAVDITLEIRRLMQSTQAKLQPCTLSVSLYLNVRNVTLCDMVALGNALQIIDEFNLEAAQYCLSV